MKTLLQQASTPYPARVEIAETSTPKMSFFRAPIHNVCPSESLDLEELYRRISGKRYSALTQRFRELKDPKERRVFKSRSFDYVTPSGLFSKRSEEGLLQHSGLLVVDLDDLEDVPQAKQLLLGDTELRTELLFTSPSGNGLKWLVACELEQWSHAQYFKAVSNYLQRSYGLKADPSGRDVCRACFIPHDPEAVLGGDKPP